MVEYDVEHPDLEAGIDDIMDTIHDFCSDLINDINNLSLDEISSGRLGIDHLVTEPSLKRLRTKITDLINNNIAHSIEIEPTEN
jgi:hypothetical protein